MPDFRALDALDWTPKCGECETRDAIGMEHSDCCPREVFRCGPCHAETVEHLLRGASLKCVECHAIIKHIDWWPL